MTTGCCCSFSFLAERAAARFLRFDDDVSVELELDVVAGGVLRGRRVGIVLGVRMRWM